MCWARAEMRLCRVQNAECRVSRESQPKLSRICIFDLQSTAKLSFVCLTPPPMLRCLSPWLSFSILFLSFRSICHSLWILNWKIREYNSKQKRHNRAQSTFFVYQGKVKRIIAFSLTHNVISKVRKGLLWNIIFRYHIFIMMIICNTQAQHVE